jgi:hypothetical protein
MIAFGEMGIHHTNDGIKIEADDHWIKIGGMLMWDLDSVSAGFWYSEDEVVSTRPQMARGTLRIPIQRVSTGISIQRFG